LIRRGQCKFCNHKKDFSKYIVQKKTGGIK